MTFMEKMVVNLLSCPECKSPMKETARREENGNTFIWLECTRSDCKGQWLHKVPAPRAKVRVAGQMAMS